MYFKLWHDFPPHCERLLLWVYTIHLTIARSWAHPSNTHVFERRAVWASASHDQRCLKVLVSSLARPCAAATLGPTRRYVTLFINSDTYRSAGPPPITRVGV
jgi:hypothetical protein